MYSQSMIQMNTMAMMNPNCFIYTGNSLSLQARLDSLSDEELRKYSDCNIDVTGVQLKAYSFCSLILTFIFGNILIFPYIFMCMDWWKKCTYAAYQISPQCYMSLGKILKSSWIKNMTLKVRDNTFDQAKAQILYNHLAQSQTRGFTFINVAGDHNYNNNQYNDFVKNMRPIKSLTHIISDLRWSSQIVNG